MSGDSALCTIHEAMAELRSGRMIVLVDDEHRENEGDLVLAAENVTAERVNFMLTHARGYLCLALACEIADRLALDPQTIRNTATLGTAFTVTVDARPEAGVGSGVSAADRARTIAVCMNERSTPADLVRPGHVNPLRAQDGGVLVRAGHTEGSVDLVRLAGLKPGAVICEVLRDDGEVARLPDLIEFCRRWQIRMCTIEELIKFRRAREVLVKRETELRLPTPYGEFDLIAYRSTVDPEPHIALTLGGIGKSSGGVAPPIDEPVLVRVHSECLTGDVFHSLLCDCGMQLHSAMERIGQEGRGVILYMRQEGRGIGIFNKLRAYKLQQDENLDTVEANRRLGFPADLRHYGIGAQILFDLGVRQIRLLTNNPKKVVAIDGYGLHITEQVPIRVPPNPMNQKYLETKRAKLGHLLNPTDEPAGSA
jgi:3,4-dihydroxy 2-butanone 4-phosphate synthase/GTP cyclohydrolase II